VKTRAVKKQPLTGLEKWNVRRGFNVKRREVFYQDLASFVGEGITPYRAMERMLLVARPRRTMQWLVKLLVQVTRRMDEGVQLGPALAPWVPGEEAALLSAGESGGRLRESLVELSGLLAKKRLVISTLIASLVPSLTMMVVLALLMVYILNTVLKEARSLVPDDVFAKLTFAPLYFNLGEVFLAALPWAVIGIIAGSIAVSASLPRWRPTKVRMFLDRHVPPYTLFTRTQSSFFLITASSMMQAGTPFQGAVEQIQKMSSPWVKTHSRRMLGKLSHGLPEAEAMQTGILPWDTEDRLAVYKMLDDFKRVMASTARDSMEILIKKVKLMGDVIKVLSMLVLASFMFLTIFAIGEIALEAQSSMSAVQRSS